MVYPQDTYIHRKPASQHGCVLFVYRKKREMERKYGQGGANELHLYHGTQPEIVQNIVHDNFDFRIAGSRVGALYGDGSYFATTAKYSDLYASQDSNTGYKTIFVAKVLAGKITVGKPGMKRPPQIDPSDFKKGYYDSVVNNVLSPNIYCVFDMNQYYPEYYVEYHWFTWKCSSLKIICDKDLCVYSFSMGLLYM